jgi:clan AA aspartic protease (TIGR02281 family)
MESIKARGLRMNKTLFLLTILIALALPASAEMYKWVDEKGTVHFTDDISSVPEKFREGIEERETPKGTPVPESKEKPTSSPVLKASEPEGMEVNLLRSGEVWLAEVVLNRKVRRNFVVDTGASFTLISTEAAKELGLTIDENTPFIPIASVSSVILTPLVTLKSVMAGMAELENVDALIYTMPSGRAGLLGNSFLNRFRVVLDSVQGKMTLFPLEGSPSADRPGGYGRDYWVGRFRFYNRYLSEFKRLKAEYERRGARSELNRVNNAIRYFENQLSELERKASSAGVPRNWRD